MATAVRLPSMGEGVQEATINSWLVSVGDSVSEDQAIVEVSTDKVDTEIVAPMSGVIVKIIAKPDTTVEVDQVIAVIGTSLEDTVVEGGSNEVTPKQESSESTNGNTLKSRIRNRKTSEAPIDLDLSALSATGAQAPSRILAGPVRATPIARKLAKQLGVPLSEISGGGTNGKITKLDVYKYSASNLKSQGSVETTQHSSEPTKANANIFKQSTIEKEGVEYLEGVPITREPMSKMRRLIADHMVRSVRTSPHVTTTIEIDLDRVMKFRATNKESFLNENGCKLTMTPFFAEAAVYCLKEFPLLNASVDGYDILKKETVNLGVAVAIETGLIVPVIKGASKLDLKGLAIKLNDLATRARTNKLKPDEVTGGSFSITNPGMFGCLHSSPIINQPQVAILSVGAIIKKPVVIKDEIAIRPMCPIGITFDHRIVDGEQGAKFLATFKSFLENYAE